MLVERPPTIQMTLAMLLKARPNNVAREDQSTSMDTHLENGTSDNRRDV